MTTIQILSNLDRPLKGLYINDQLILESDTLSAEDVLAHLAGMFDYDFLTLHQWDTWFEERGGKCPPYFSEPPYITEDRTTALRHRQHPNPFVRMAAYRALDEMRRGGWDEKWSATFRNLMEDPYDTQVELRPVRP